MTPIQRKADISYEELLRRLDMRRCPYCGLWCAAPADVDTKGECGCCCLWEKPYNEGPLAGHAAACAKVTTATITGDTSRPCSCGKDA